jgi:poly(A) polymerase/tRNA nucleotidyltransferase (CCA-adding enzyme)
MTKDKSGIHFYGHDVEGAKMTESILNRLRMPKNDIQRVVNLVRWHMFYYPSAEWRKEYGDVFHLETKDGGWTDSAVRRFIKKVGENAIEDLFKLRIADANANPKSGFEAREIEIFANRISEVRKQDMALKVSDLDISGRDLIEIGIQPGPQMGQILNKLLDMVIEEPGMNSKELLLDASKDLLKKGLI